MEWSPKQAYLLGQIVGELKVNNRYCLDAEEEAVYTRVIGILEQITYQNIPISMYEEVNDDELTH